MNQKHNKHGRITRWDIGQYAKHEYAVMGTNCTQIKEFCDVLAKHFIQYKVSFLDANHNVGEEDDVKDAYYHIKYMDNIRYHQFDIRDSLNKFQLKKLYNDSDLVLINGNHFEAQAQIVFLDPKKDKSLYKRRHQLTDIKLFIEMDDSGYFPIFLEEMNKNIQKTEKININELNEILLFLEQKLQNNITPITGLILAGGKSTRMGEDKGKIQLSGKDSRIHLYELLESFCDDTFISGRSDQAKELQTYPFLEDRLKDMGPFGALISAFMKNPNTAWLVVATDLYQLEEGAIDQLISNRNPSKIATAFINESTGFPDPLCTIWEPKSYAHLLEFMRLGYSCPRKVLINSNVTLISPHNQEWLFNVNTKEELHSLINKKT